MRFVVARSGARGLVILALVLSPVACGGSARNPPGGGATNTGQGDSNPGTFSEATHAPLPQLTLQGGPLLTAPKIVTITFPGDANAATLEAFDDSIVTSSWWDAVTAGFCDDMGACIGHGSSGGHVRLTTPPDATYTDATGGGPSTLQLFIGEQINQGVLPPTDADTLYVLYFPYSSVITLSESNVRTATSCAQFGGYHNAMNVTGSVSVPYVIVQECPLTAAANLTPIQALTFAASHEIVEAASDPVQTSQKLGYYLNLTDKGVLGWNLLLGGEAGDLCVDVAGLHQDETTADGYTVQRIWSNANAAKGIDPCVPAPAADTYFNVAPQAPNSFLVLDVGASATFEVDAFSTAPMSPWTLEGIDGATAAHGVNSPLLSFTFNGAKTATVNNGDKVQVTVTLDADPGQFGGAEGILLSVSGSRAAPTGAHPWPILVVTPAEAQGGT